MRQIYPLDDMIVHNNPVKFVWRISRLEDTGRAVTLSIKQPNGQFIFKNVSPPEHSIKIQLPYFGEFEWYIAISAGLMGIPSSQSQIRKFRYQERKRNGF